MRNVSIRKIIKNVIKADGWVFSPDQFNWSGWVGTPAQREVWKKKIFQTYEARSVGCGDPSCCGPGGSYNPEVFWDNFKVTDFSVRKPRSWR